LLPSFLILATGSIIPKGRTEVYINIAPIIDFLPLDARCGTIPLAGEIAKHLTISRITKNLAVQKGSIVFVSPTLQQAHGLFSAIFQ
jgi:hypothetical protein